ncbi:chymotrypsin-like elastase family member 2A [Haliotis rufescens]|uniref:chymotrypsin-like elastase family member 2A n=1 Tax=Haliotis rufescens TaxID=6454 RepID=UPI00201F917A|nr:chymotrypsin-like elastase family member 2A [Haliotis rufescens]
MNLLPVLVSMCMIYRGADGAEICSVLYPGSSCQQQCPGPSVTKDQGFPYCYSGAFCCETAATTTPPTTTTPEPVTTAIQPSRVCGFDALPMTPRVLNTHPLSPDDFSCAWPWMVHVLLGRGGSIQPLCSGVLVSKQHFITLRSFVEPVIGASLQLYAAVGICNITGLHSTTAFPSGTLKRVDIDMTTYDAGNLDLVVAKLVDEVEDYSIQVLPACLPDESTVVNENQCFMAGASDGAMGAGRVTVFNPAVCTAVNSIDFGRNMPQPEGTFCTNVGSDNVHACEGDEGGMVMCQDEEDRWVLKGIIQNGTCNGARRGTNTIIDIEEISSDLISNVFP